MGVGLGSNQGGFWTPSAGEGLAGNAPGIGTHILEQSPQTAFFRRGAQLGIPDDTSAFGRWFRQQFPNYALGYQAYTVSNPLTANIVDYTNSLGGYDDWYRRFTNLAPQLRGLDPASRGGGPTRWVSR